MTHFISIIAVPVLCYAGKEAEINLRSLSNNGNTKMDSKYIGKLSTQIGSEWQLFGVHLGFTISQMEQLRSAYPTSIPQCVSIMLSQWQSVLEDYGKSTISILADALRDTGRADLADDLCGSFQRLSIDNKRTLEQQDSIDTLDSIDELDGNSDITRQQSIQKRQTEDYLEGLKKVKFENTTSDPLYKYIEQSKAFMEHKLMNSDVYVKTRAFEKAVNCLTENGILTIIGNAGDGKTTLAVNILHHLHKQGYNVLVFSDPGILEQAIDPDRQIVYFVDDAFGTPTLNKTLVGIWRRLYDKIDSLVSKHKMNLVLTSRKMVVLKAKSFINSCDRFLQSFVDISDKDTCLTKIEKRMLVSKYSHGHGLFPLETIFKSSDYTPGFPLLCKLFATNKRLRSLKDFFESPIVVLQKDISELLDHDIFSYCVLVLIVLHDGKLPVEYLDVFEDDQMDEIKLETIVKAYGLNRMTVLSKMESAVETIKGVYIEEINDMYVFLHDSIFDAVCLVFGQKHPKEILQIASSEFIEHRVRTKNVLLTDNTQIVDVIVLKKSHFKHFSKRWISDIIKGKIRCVFNNPSIQDKELMPIFIDNIKKLTSDKFEEFMRSCEGQRSLIEFVCEDGHTDLASNLLKQMKCIDSLYDYEVPTKCLHTAIEKKDATLVRLLLDYGVRTESCIRPYKTNSVHWAARVGDVRILQMVLEKDKNKSISCKDFFGLEPIHHACQNSNTECLELLIRNGGDVNGMDLEGKSPIHYAAYAGSEECVKVLHKAGAKLNEGAWMTLGKTPLHYASMSDNMEVVCYLLDQKCNPNVTDEDNCTPLFYASKNGRWRTIKALIHGGADPSICNKFNKRPIHAAAEGCHSDFNAANACLKLLLGVNSDINAIDDQGKTALHYACAWSYDHRFDSVQVLVELDADVSIKDGFKMTPLMYACNSGSFKCAALLLQNGADPNCEGTRQNKPIHLASADGNIEIVKLLMSKSVDIRVKNEDGRQPIHFASQYGNDDVVCLLVWNGVDVNAKDNSGKEPLHYACKWGRAKTVKLIMKLGGNPHSKDNNGLCPKDLIPQWASNSKFIRQCLSSSSNSL